MMNTVTRALCLHRTGPQPPAPAWDEDGDDGPVEEFTEDEVVQLHWWLLQKVAQLGIDTTPLDEKFEIVRWVFTDTVRDTRPFSFVSCLRVAACSPMSRLPFMGSVDPEEVRNWIAARLPGWFEATLRLYPPWVRQAVISNPAWVADRLARNPQWLNQEVKRHHGNDLFD